MPFPPTTLLIKSDQNELTFKEILKPHNKGEAQYIYQYTRSESKLNTFLGLNEKELRTLMENNPVA